MPEALPRWPAQEPEEIHYVPSEHERVEFASLKDAYLRDRQEVEDFRNSDECVKGGSSFYDISGNLLSVIGSSVRYYEEFHEPETLEKLRVNVDYLDRYLALLHSDADIRKKELGQQDGAFPEIRQMADKAHQMGHTSRPIAFYLDQIAPGDAKKLMN